MSVFQVVVTAVVLVGIAIAIWLFERPRAQEIERDLRDQARRQQDPENPSGQD